jgi:3-phenylpropionate/trans-cinnamate dioxygenase ferredoxin reductase subunit
VAEAAGIAVDNGITTDERFRTSAPDVYAAGDVAFVRHPRYGRHIRVEHWDTAKSHGAAAARAMLGGDEPYEQLPYFFSDQYDLGLEYVGLHSPDDEVTIRGSLADQRFQVFWTGADGTVTAGMHVNDWDAIATIRDVVAGHQAVA